MSKVTITVKSNPDVNIVDSPSPKKRVLKRSCPENNPLSSTIHSKIPCVDPKIQAVLNSIPKDQKKSNPLKKFSPLKKTSLVWKPNSKRKSSGVISKLWVTGFDGEMESVLGTLQKSPGFGNHPKKILYSNLLDESNAVTCFSLFVSEKQKIWIKKYKGKKNLTSNEIMDGKWFTNI